MTRLVLAAALACAVAVSVVAGVGVLKAKRTVQAWIRAAREREGR